MALSELDRARTADEVDGFIKVIVDPKRVAQTPHAYPTWSIGVRQTVGQLFGYGPHKPRPTRSD